MIHSRIENRTIKIKYTDDQTITVIRLKTYSEQE